MNIVKIAGIILIVAGALALAYGGFTYTSEKHSAEVGSLHMSIDEKQQVNIPVWAGIGAIVFGGMLLLLPMREK